jgi:AcrR family transcriptional regulator
MSVTSADELLDAALVVVARHGTRRLTMDDVAVAAGVSRQTLYRYFPTKAQLLAAVATHVERRLEDRLTAAVAEGADARAQLHGALLAMITFLDDSMGQHMADVEPAFVIERLRRSLVDNTDAIERTLHDALAASPAVRSGAATTTSVANLLVRIAGSHHLAPERDPDALLATLEALVLGPPGR